MGSNNSHLEHDASRKADKIVDAANGHNAVLTAEDVAMSEHLRTTLTQCIKDNKQSCDIDVSSFRRLTVCRYYSFLNEMFSKVRCKFNDSYNDGSTHFLIYFN